MAGPRALATMLSEIAGKALGKRGLSFGPLLTDWPAIVGPHLSERTHPDKLSFPRGCRDNATLSVRVASAFAVEIQHLEPLIIARINGFFGYAAVSKLKIVPGPAVGRLPGKPPVPRQLTAEEESRIAATAAGIADPELRDAMSRFGRAMLARRQRS